MTDADFLSITRNGRLCDGDGGLGAHEFELVMREQVCLEGPPPFLGMSAAPASAALGPVDKPEP